jgi:hypothetical protein
MSRSESFRRRQRRERREALARREARTLPPQPFVARPHAKFCAALDRAVADLQRAREASLPEAERQWRQQMREWLASAPGGDTFEAIAPPPVLRV